MGWGEVRDRGAGTTGEIEEAHKALDRLLIKNGPLAVRAKQAAAIIANYDEVRVFGEIVRRGNKNAKRSGN